MEASDFVGDSDEDEQELLETHVDAEEDGSHQGDDAASSDTSVAAPDPVEAAQEPAQDEAEDKQTQEDEPATGLAVGDLVLVQSRTWPGINKLGGAGRVVRVHREANEAGEEELFYDVRYVLGGFEKHIESEFVQLSKLLEQDPSRETVEREYYHDDYINAPHLKKQQEAAKKRERAAAHPEEKEMLNKRRKRSHRAARAAREEDNVEEKAPGHRQEVHGDAEAVEVQTIREDTFIIQENKPSSLEESSRPLRGTERSTGRRREVLPTEMEPRAASLRRKNRIIVSSDEESSDDADKNGHEQNEEPGHSSEHVRGNPEVPYRAEQNLQPVGKRNLRHRHKRKRMRASKSRRYVGGYEQDGDDADATFIQPEGDPAELPEDVIRDTGLRLRTTKEGLKAQLHEVYTEQKKNMVYFQEEQKEINLKMSSLSGMPMSDLKNLHEKVTELSRYLTRTLVKGGEDVMNTIMEKLDKKYRELPGALQQLESDIEDNWMAKLKECDQWMRHVRGTVENAFVLREEQIPMEVAAQAEYSSDSGQSSYYPDDQEVSDLHGSDSDDIDLSFEYETSLQENVRLRNEKHRRNSNTGQRRSTTSTKVNHRKKFATSTTLDDFFAAQEPTSRYKSKFRLVGKQKNFSRSDPRWRWFELARKKIQHSGARNRSTGAPSMQSSGGLASFRSSQGNTRTNARNHDESLSVQARRMQLRDKRFRGHPTQQRTRGAFVRASPSTLGNRNEIAFSSGILLDDITPEKRPRPADSANATIHPSSSKVHPVNWEAIFEVLSDGCAADDNDDSSRSISRKEQQVLSEFGYPICGPLVPARLFCDGALEFEDCDNFDDTVARRASHLQQQMNDLRLQEGDFMESLARQGLSAGNEEGYTSSTEWISLVSLEEAYHTAVASFAAQMLEGLDGLHPSTLPSHLRTVLEVLGSLIRQLPDCEALFGRCKAYFFYFEVASRDARTTPLLTAISRAYLYSLQLLVAVRSSCVRLMGSQVSENSFIDDLFMKILPVNRVRLASMLFLFDLYLYLPSSHRVGNEGSDNSDNHSKPALALWLVVRECSLSNAGLTHHESITAKEKEFWILLRTVYQERYLDELARCFVRGDSCGGYMRDFTPKAPNESNPENREEVLESQLLALEATWDLVSVLSRICTDAENDDHGQEISDSKWAVVKELLHLGKRDFLPFNPGLYPAGTSAQEYHHCSNQYKRDVLQRILKFSQQWHPSKDVTESIVQQMWSSSTSNRLDDVMELPVFMQQFAVHCKDVGNTKSCLTEFVKSSDIDEEDSTALLCKIIWVQLAKLDKRVHRSRFRRSVLNAIPSPPDRLESSGALAPTLPVSQAGSATNWIWNKQNAAVNTQPAKTLPQPTIQRVSSWVGAEKERMSTSILLTFAIVAVCLECGDELIFPSDRADKDIRYLEREVDFYTKEILRWASGTPESEVVVSQALYILGALLLEKKSTEFPSIFWGLNSRLESSVKNLQANSSDGSMAGSTKRPSKDRDLEKRRRLQSATLSPLYQMRDLTRQLVGTVSSGVGYAYGTAYEKSLESILSTGVEACLNGAIHKTVAMDDLKIAMEIFQLLLPRANDELNQSVAVIPGATEVDEFGDADDALCAVDEDALSGRTNATQLWYVEKSRPKVIQLITNNLRMVLQQLVLHYPQGEAPAFDELYAIDLLGMMISSCEVQFFWSNVTSNFVKPRNLAPRVLSAALKYNPRKEWLGNFFLRENRADHALANAWLMGTLDVLALNSRPVAFEHKSALFSIGSGVTTSTTAASAAGCRDSNYWLVLTDGIIYHMLRCDPVGLHMMNPLILQLLRGVASTCKFPQAVQANESSLQDVATLYDLHLDVFKAFCRSAGTMWHAYIQEPSIYRDEMNQFRAKTMNPQSGIFVSFLEAYKLNFRRACSEIDKVNHHWHSFAELFLRQAGERTSNGCSYHTMDDTIKSFDQRLTGLTTMFRFTYQCMDAFLFYCGEMAIGETNLFFDMMELLFGQVASTEYSQATKRLLNERPLNQRSGVRDVNKELQKGICLPAMAFVNSVQLFFARQKYPSLLYWFAQTSDIYQTFKSGWSVSPLRTLLVNILDPEGPLGIHSYYPEDHVAGDAGRKMHVGTIRREAFYLSCGLFTCKSTNAFEHSQSSISSDAKNRLKLLRTFVLDDFVKETLGFAVQQDETCLLETMVPLCQFVRAVLNHANLNVNTCRGACLPSGHSQEALPCNDFNLQEVHGCLELIVQCLIKSVGADEVINSTICCVLGIELCGIICEAIALNDHWPLLELIELIEVVLCYLYAIYETIAKTSTKPLDPLFTSSVRVPPSEKMSAYQFQTSDFRDIMMEQIASFNPRGQWDSYGINLVRTRTDLLSAIGRVAEQCKNSSDERLRSTAILSAPIS